MLPGPGGFFHYRFSRQGLTETGLTLPGLDGDHDRPRDKEKHKLK